MNKLFILTLFAMMLVAPLVNADLGTFKQGEPVNIKTILNTSSVNISTISFPNSTTLTINEEMSKSGLTFNYTFTQTEPLGTYIYDYFDAEGNVYVNTFTITPSGTLFTNALSIPVFLPMIMMLLVSVFFLVLMPFVDNPSYKISFMIIGGLFLVMTIAFAIIAGREIFWGFPLLYGFINAFYKIFIIVAPVGAFIVAIIAMFYVIKRVFNRRGYEVGEVKNFNG